MKTKKVLSVDGKWLREIVSYDLMSDEELAQIPLHRLEYNVSKGDRGKAWEEFQRRKGRKGA